MKLEELLLRKEEVSIVNERGVVVPIHPAPLNAFRVDPDIAHNVFPQAAEEWYDELQAYARTVDDEEKGWLKEQYLNKPLQIRKEYGRQIVDPPGFWTDDVITRENGFASSLMIDRDAGSSLYLENSILDIFVVLGNLKLSEEKLREFSSGYVYAPHNVDYYPGALFLRNWALLYENEVLKQM